MDEIADAMAPNCPSCLESMEIDDGAWSWGCHGCEEYLLPGREPQAMVADKSIS